MTSPRENGAVARVAALVLAGLFACGGRASPPAQSSPAGSLPPLPPTAPDAYARNVTIDGVSPQVAFHDADDPELTPPDRQAHVAAREAAKGGRLYEAKRILGRLAVAYPDHPILVDQFNAVVSELARAKAASKTSLEAAPLRVLDAPPAAYTLVARARTDGSPVPRLVKASEKRNTITDDEAWFERNAITLPSYFVPPSDDFLFADRTVTATTVSGVLGRFAYTEHTPSARFLHTPLPMHIPLAYGTRTLREAIASDPYVVCIYGGVTVAVFDELQQVVALLDLTAFAHPPASRSRDVKVDASLTVGDKTARIDLTQRVETIHHALTWALARDGVLYVEHTNQSYAKENAGQNAYVTAIDLASGELRWRSAALVANTHAFTLASGAIVTGYGFTDEPDFVHVLDRATGAIAQKIAVRSGPDYVVAKGGKLFVRTYDTDYVFDAR